MAHKFIFSPTLLYFCFLFNFYHLPFSTKLFVFLILFYLLNLFLLYVSFFPAFTIVFLPKRRKQLQVSHIRSQLVVVVA
jgi:hypothetical protein